MLDSLISCIAPHPCIQCQIRGSLVCAACLSELIEGRVAACLMCGMPCGELGICTKCNRDLRIERACLFGERKAALRMLIDCYKFSGKRAAHKSIAALLQSMLPYRLPNDTSFVPVPTIQKHIRERGYDHMSLITNTLARRHGASSRPLLMRTSNTVQRGASKRQRHQQAARMFAARKTLDASLLYILVDDVVTTGASIRAAVAALRRAGARRIWVMALARQPLDEQG